MENGVENDVGSNLSDRKNKENRGLEERSVEDVGVGIGSIESEGSERDEGDESDDSERDEGDESEGSERVEGDESDESERDEIFEVRVEDVEGGVGGRDESKDSEGEETFEEATDLLQEHSFSLDSETVDYVDGGNIEGGKALGSSPEVVDGNSDVENEVETFEEAIGVVDVAFHEEEGTVGVDEKVDDLEDSGKDLNQVVDDLRAEVTDPEVSIDESKDSLVDVETVEESSDAVANGGTHIVENGLGLGIVLEDSGYGDLKDVNREVEIVADQPSEQKNGNITHQDDKFEHFNDGSLERGNTNVQIDEENALSNVLTSEDEDDEAEFTKALASLEIEHHDDEVGEVEVVSPRVVTREAEEAVDFNASDAVSDSDYLVGDKNDELKGATTGLTSGKQTASSEKSCSVHSDVDSKLRDGIRELKDASASVDSGIHKDADITPPFVQPDYNLQSSPSSNIIDASVEDNRVSPEAVSSHSEKSLEKPSSVVSEDSQAQKPTESPVEAHINGTLPDSPEMIKANHKTEKKVIQGNGIPEGEQSAREAMLDSRRSINPTPVPTPTPTSTPVPTHPAGLGGAAGLGRAAPLLEPAPRVMQQSRVNGTVSQMQTQLVDDSTNGESEELDETREKLQMIRVKFLRLAHRLGQTPHNVVVAQVLYRLGLAEQLRGRNNGRVGGFSFDRASAMAEQLESAGQEPLDFSCTIMVLGKTGVGKSSTINSIFDEVKFDTDAFKLATKKVQDVVGIVQGIKVRVIDTPGLLPSWSDQRQNEKILLSVKKFMKKTPPDIVLYLDRLDMQSRDFGDMPLLRTITEIFGPSIWFNAIVVLTHAGSAPPDGPNGTASSYDMFVTQRSHVVQQAIRGAAGDMRLMNPVSLVENHSACRTNRAGQRVLPNGQVWKPHLLLLSFASKILAEANTLLKLQDSPPGQPFATRSRAPSLVYLLSNLLQSRPQLKLPDEQFGDDDNLDDDLDESDLDEESEYDELPPFKPLTKTQLSNLTKAQKKAYFDEREYRENLLMKKQLREEKRRRKMMKEMEATVKDLPNDYNDSAEEEAGGAASVPVPMPDLALPASFDSDNPTHRYRHLDSNQWLVRPVLETHGWDHDVGYEGINVERLFAVKEKIPVSFSGQVTKDKKDANVQMEVASSIKHGKGKATSVAVDMQTVGKDMAYTLRSETNFSNYTRNKANAGVSCTLLGDSLSAGLKLEDKLIVNKCLRFVMSGGAMAGRGDVAYGGSLEATLRDKDYPLGRWLSSLALSVMDWHGELAIGCNLQSQIPVGRHTNLIARANLNNRGSGQVSLRLNSSEQLQIALIGLIPIFKKLYGDFQQLQMGQ